MHCKRDLGWFTQQVVGIAAAEPCDYPEMKVTVDFHRDQGDSPPFGGPCRDGMVRQAKESVGAGVFL